MNSSERTSSVAPSSSPCARSSKTPVGEGSVVVNEVKSRKGNEGYNVATGEYTDLVKAGVVDPTKVTRSALQNAASISGLLLTTECVVTELPEKDKPAAPGGHGGGGMGWHGRNGLLRSCGRQQGLCSCCRCKQPAKNPDWQRSGFFVGCSGGLLRILCIYVLRYL